MGVRAVGQTLSAMSAQQLLFKLSGANLQLTTDQPFTKLYSGSSYFISSVIARQRTGSASALTAGGIYTGANKTGDILVSSASAWASLALGVIVTPTLASLIATNLESATPILSLSIASSTACTADYYIFGCDIS